LMLPEALYGSSPVRCWLQPSAWVSDAPCTSSHQRQPK
jgi:hypothetical protein